ncbi:MAG: hypothetical protein HQQ73_10465 [Desulfobulbaceae bacterium]|nr:hypothetical protein [Desulfobulbaceae bacterium]
MRVHIKAAKREAEKLLKHDPLRGQMGFCHLYWTIVKRILWEKHGIDWKSPAEMNPDVFFD